MDRTNGKHGVPPATAGGRLLLVSNRLPVTAVVDAAGVRVEPSTGGLATGLRGPHQRSESLWIGWPGDLPKLRARRRAELDEQLAAMRCVPVHLSKTEIRRFYDDISNGVLWPLFHYLLDQLPQDARGWESYRQVNQKFADEVAAHYRPGDLIWIHDYHLMLLPQMLRDRLPAANIGFFLHIPFPSSEVFSVLPWREEILEGLLGADLVGFHTPPYLRHFATSLRRVLGVDVDVDRVLREGREVRLGVFPMGIDASGWENRGQDPEVQRRAEEIRSEGRGQKLLVGIDRLDYTKGIPRRLLAIERLFETDPELREQVRVVQVTVPSREKAGPYAEFRKRIDELVGRINSTYGTPGWVPIHSLHRSLSEEEVAALYRAADVMLVTPLRDGMNLVSKEFVATRTDRDGVLVLSEFAGAASELGEALQVNPYDVEHMAARIRQALLMPAMERRSRMRALRLRVMSHDADRWSQSFLDAMLRIRREMHARETGPAEDAFHAAARLREQAQLLLILDYDGTLMPFADTPDAAQPDEELVELLAELAARKGTRVHVVSGRSRQSMERWLGHLPIGLHTEHGLWSRLRPEEPWTLLRPVQPRLKDKVRPIFEHFTSTTRGSFIEEKTASIAWHYRLATGEFTGDNDFGEQQAKELRLLLAELLSNEPMQVISGAKVVEVRPMGVNKGTVAPLLLADAGTAARVVAIGDDRTDEDLFMALPPSALCMRVGDGPSVATYRLADPQEVRTFLRGLLSPSAVEKEAAAV
ncbi:MAG: bifunctional alpha,alpha-trehalose-phosphate synthase (UDP-forming)/trehalose-phosphatase [Chloroflexi bacterium]|nr:bifunctional alpha,alpha-trehalose-phosphate synthase (UDP-forming)/trehalose-phosphatase [Chloroflexota bacterium]